MASLEADLTRDPFARCPPCAAIPANNPTRAGACRSVARRHGWTLGPRGIGLVVASDQTRARAEVTATVIRSGRGALVGIRGKEEEHARLRKTAVETGSYNLHDSIRGNNCSVPV